MTLVRCCLAAAALCLAPVAADAQTLPGLGSVDRIGVARLRFSEVCPRFDAAERLRDEEAAAEAAARRARAIAALVATGLSLDDATTQIETEEMDEVVVTGSAAAFTPIVAGVIGDAATVLVNTGAAALEEASRARAIGVLGTTSFEFYRIRMHEGAGVDLAPNFGPDADSGQACLILEAIPDTPLESGAPIYAEITLRPRKDGFILEPVYVAYAEALPGAPAHKKLAAELHIEFSTPGVTTAGVYTAQVFGLARIPLPPLEPGDIREGPGLRLQSEVLPFRPEDGSIATARTRLTVPATAEARREELFAARVRFLSTIGRRFPDGLPSSDEVAVFFECVTQPLPTALRPEAEDADDTDAAPAMVPARPRLTPEQELAERRRYVEDDNNACAAAKAELAELEAAALKADEAGYKTARSTLVLAEAAWLAAASSAQSAAEARRSEEVEGGSTSVRVRFVLIKNENRYGTAIATALKARAASVGTAVAGEVGPEVWTIQGVEAAQAQLKVNRAATALATAQASGDEALIRAAEDALVTARLELNVAETAAGRTAPYPGLSALRLPGT